MDDTLRDKPPSERGDIMAKAEAYNRKMAEARINALRQDITRTFSTAHGKRVMALIKQRSGFGQVILSADRQTGQIDPMATTYAAMELNFYIFLRNHLPHELIMEIEDERRIEPSGTISDPGTGSTTSRSTSKSSTGGRKRSRRDASE